MKVKAVFVALLLLLLQNNLQETESVEQKKLVDPASELRQLRNIVYEMGTALTDIKMELKYVKKENAELKTKQIKAESNSEGFKKEVSALKSRLATSEDEVKQLKRTAIERPKIAFMAGLASTKGPLSNDSNVVYPNVLANVGGAYNSLTGVFTAPVTGVYYIKFTSCSKQNGYISGMYLYKNQEYILYVLEYNYNGYFRYTEAGSIVQLNAGDVVYTRLPKSCVLWESKGNCNTFSGFILFAM